MKTKRIITGLVACGLATLTYVHAQTANGSGKLEQAVGLLENGQIKEARAVLGTVDPQDADYATARGLHALCLYKQNKNDFLDALESGKIQSLDMPAELHEELDYRQIEVLLVCRKFEALLPKTEAFARHHANSSWSEAVTEYQLAALFERGMKNLKDATFTRAGKGSNNVVRTEKRMQVGQANLEQFLKLAAEVERNRYQTLTNRDLSVEVAKAMTALGGESEALNMVPAAEHEDMALALVQLHNKIDADAADANLARMTNFLNTYPNSKHSKRVHYDMGNVAFDEGWRLSEAGKYREAAPYLKMVPDFLTGVMEDKQAGLSKADEHQAQIRRLGIYYAQWDWPGFSSYMAQISTNFPPDAKEQLVIKLYHGYALSRQKKFAEANSNFEEILATGFKGNPSYDGLLISAADWHVRISNNTGDPASARRLVRLVQNSKCYGSIKREFLNHFREFLTSTDSIAK